MNDLTKAISADSAVGRVEVWEVVVGFLLYVYYSTYVCLAGLRLYTYYVR